MNGKEIVTMCAAIIKRQDLNEDLLLQFINQQRRHILRETYLYRIQKWEIGLEPEDGFVRTKGLKQARYVEWNPDPEDNVKIDFNAEPNKFNGVETERKKKLFPLNTIQEAFEIYDNVDVIGEPMYYVVMQGGLKIIPAPPIGVINIFGEWYPEDLSNSEDSEDGLSKEIADIIIYYACAEYFDFLMEPEKANLWRGKGQALLQGYIHEIKLQQTDDRPLFARDPFGNLNIGHGWRRNVGFVYPIDELTGGTQTDTYTEPTVHLEPTRPELVQQNGELLGQVQDLMNQIELLQQQLQQSGSENQGGD